MRFFLIGLPGCGKSFWADKLGRITNMPSFHLDDAIEEAEQQKISTIFSDKGEDYFRQKETAVLKSFIRYNNVIVSVGGGTPCFNNNMNWMNENGVTIWIDEPSQTIEKRLLKGKAHRPLIATLNEEELLFFVEDMYRKRSPFYSKANYHLQHTQINEQAFLNILSKYE